MTVDFVKALRLKIEENCLMLEKRDVLLLEDVDSQGGWPPFIDCLGRYLSSALFYSYL